MTENTEKVVGGLADGTFASQKEPGNKKGSDLLISQDCETCGRHTSMGDVDNRPYTTLCILKKDGRYHRYCSEGCNK